VKGSSSRNRSDGRIDCGAVKKKEMGEGNEVMRDTFLPPLSLYLTWKDNFNNN
jgi:hypothetical protein